jgi:HAE1 family hydrophobic/amphiphilic exporter-1
MEACRERARPIIMTTLAMMAGMLPTALTLGKGSEFRQPMAVAVIGGLITSTILSLVLVAGHLRVCRRFRKVDLTDLRPAGDPAQCADRRIGAGG